MRVLLVALSVIIALYTRGTEGLQFNVLSIGNLYRFQSPENSGEDGSSLGTVVCTEDGGASLNGPVSYSIVVPTNVPFDVDSTSGEVSLMNGETLDFETSQSYTFAISCSYVADPTTTATADVMFTVEPVNEYPPVLDDNTLSVIIPESTPVGTVLVARGTSGVVSMGQFTVSDDDDGADGVLTFTPQENIADFQLDETTGTLTLSDTFDLDSLQMLIVSTDYTIIICDGDREIDTCPRLVVSVRIVVANDNAPEFESELYEITVAENATVGSSLLTVVCTDADFFNGVFAGITVLSSDSPVYIPNPTNGTVILRDNLDFEETSEISVQLECRDDGVPVMTANATLLITITQVNDHAPKFNTSLFEFSVSRTTISGGEIGQVIATDSDVGDTITYTLSGAGSENFQLRSDGTLVLNEILLVIEGTFFDLTVTASDGTFETTAQVRIVVEEVLSIPEIIIVAVCGVIFIALVIIAIVILLCCCIGCYRCLPEKRKRTEEDEEMMRMQDQMDYFGPHVMLPPPSMYDHGGPVYQMAQDPRHMSGDWQGSQDLLTDTGEDEPDITLGSDPSSSRVYSPSTLKEMVEIFHEGDKVLDGKKKKKEKKQDK